MPAVRGSHTVGKGIHPDPRPRPRAPDRGRPGGATLKRLLNDKDVAVHVHDSLVELMGNTPLVRLRKVTGDSTTGGGRPQVLAKVEYFNPGGSVKDRIAVRMIDAAERSGELR